MIAVASPKGGVGKTTICSNLGHTFASLRGDRVVAIDGSTDLGTLAGRVRRQTPWGREDLLAQAGSLTSAAEVRAFTSQASSRLEVLAGVADPSRTAALEATEIQAVLGLLQRHYQLLLFDCGPGLRDAGTRAIFEAADQLVVVVGPTREAAWASAHLLSWLAVHGHQQLAEGAIAVVNGVSSSRRRDGHVAEITDYFAQQCRHVVQVPFDPFLAARANTSLGQLAAATRDAYLELAAAVAAGFEQPTVPTPAEQEALRCTP
ncbi:MAG: MinD/ParA family protein [Nitriliruptoraceae bacterium]